MIRGVVRSAVRNGKKYNVNAAIGGGPNRTVLQGNRTKNPVTKGLNEPNVRVSPRMKDGKRRVVQRDMNPLKSRVIPGPNGARTGERLEGNLYGKRGYDDSLLPAVVESNPNVINQASRRVNRGSLPGGSPMSGSTTRPQQAAAGGGGGNPPRPYNVNRGTLPGGSMKGSTAASSPWRGVEDIKNTVSGQAPLSTFFRTREARDAMMASGEGAAHKWAKGTTHWGRVAGTGAAAYAGIDTLDRIGGGGSITRNETGRFDMMGIPIL